DLPDLLIRHRLGATVLLDVCFLRGVVDGGGHPVQLVEFALDPVRARSAGHASDLVVQVENWLGCPDGAHLGGREVLVLRQVFHPPATTDPMPPGGRGQGWRHWGTDTRKATLRARKKGPREEPPRPLDRDP